MRHGTRRRRRSLPSASPQSNQPEPEAGQGVREESLVPSAIMNQIRTLGMLSLHPAQLQVLLTLDSIPASSVPEARCAPWSFGCRVIFWWPFMPGFVLRCLGCILPTLPTSLACMAHFSARSPLLSVHGRPFFLGIHVVQPEGLERRGAGRSRT